MTAASSFPHASSPAVHPHEPGHHLTTALAGALVSILDRGARAGFFDPSCDGARRRSSPLPGTGRESPGTIFVLRRRPCRARGVTCSAGFVTSPAETQPSLGVSPETLRADLAGSARTFGSLICRFGLRLQALSGRACTVLRRVSLEALHRQRLRCCRSQSTTGPTAWASSNAGQIIQEIGA